MILPGVFEKLRVFLHELGMLLVDRLHAERIVPEVVDQHRPGPTLFRQARRRSDPHRRAPPPVDDFDPAAELTRRSIRLNLFQDDRSVQPR